MIAFLEGPEWKEIVGEQSSASEYAASAIEKIHKTQESSPGKTRDRYNTLALLAPPCKDFHPQTHRKTYCSNCFKKNCQKDPVLEGDDTFPASALASLLQDQEKLQFNHGRINEDEAELRLRERREDEPELSFPERACWLLREEDPRTMVVSLLSNSTYGHHFLEFGDDLKWRERNKDNVAFGGSLLGAAKSLLDDLTLAHLKGVPCSAEMKGVNSHATYGTNLQSIDEVIGNNAAADETEATTAAEAQVFKWWAGELPKAAVRAAVGGAGSGAYMIRKSSKDGTVVLVINDNGVCVDYAISWEPEIKKWSFVGQEFSRMDDLLDMLNSEPLASKTGGYDVILKDAAPGGVEVELEKELFGIDLAPIDRGTIARVKSIRAKSVKKKVQPEPELPPEEPEEDYEVMDHSNKMSDPVNTSAESSNQKYKLTATNSESRNTEQLSETLPSEDPDEGYELPVANKSGILVNDIADMDGEHDNPPENTDQEYDTTVPEDVAEFEFNGFGESPPENTEANFVNTKKIDRTATSSKSVSIITTKGEKLGFSLSEERADGETWVVVSKVVPDGPAAGQLEVGHVVLQINGRVVEDLGPVKTKRIAADYIKLPRQDTEPLTLVVSYNRNATAASNGAQHTRLPEESDFSGFEDPSLHLDEAPVEESQLDQRNSQTEAVSLTPDISLFWAGSMKKSEVQAAVVAAGPGSFLVRTSSKQGQVVLVCNDTGHAVPYPIRYSHAHWWFASMKSPTLRGLLESLQQEKISGTKGPDYSLLGPAPGGSQFDFASWNKTSTLNI